MKGAQLADAIVQVFYSSFDDASLREMLAHGRLLPADASQAVLINAAIERELKRREEVRHE